MDPYLESWIWPDCHSTMISALRAQLNAKLPRRYIANTELYVWREDPSSQERLLLGGPDVYTAERRSEPREGPLTAAVAAPVTTVLPGVERKQRYLRVVDQSQRRIVTVIELLSPANKTASESGQAYRFKRDEYIASGVNLVEIDLLRSGIRPPLGDPAPPMSDYYMMVCRASERPGLGIWPISVREPLPPVPVPLDPGEPEVMLDLRAALDRAYEEGRYGEQLDYTKPPAPPLREPDATWARELLARHTNPPPPA
jgi:hypothetical protein